MPALIPALNGRTLTVDAALKSPTVLRDRIAQLTDEQILLPKLFRQLGAKVEGGGMLYSVVKASDFYSSDVEMRSPGSEYKIVEGVDPEPRIANPEDWGGKFQITDEQISRNDVNYLDQQTTQLANTIARKLDTRAIAAVEAAGLGTYTPLTGWESLAFVGPLDAITASADRPSAHWAVTQELADNEELGIRHDILILNPEQARQLRVAYGADLAAALESAGFTEGMHSNPRVPIGTAYTAVKGSVGTIGFETAGVVVDTWRDPATRSTWVQSYCAVAIAVDKPFAAKQITGLSD
jgi:hypothetical protein